MTRILLTGIGAGAAAALLFASTTSGVLFSVVLFYLAPLPIMIVALGWSHWAGLVAAVAAAAMLGVAFGKFLFAAFLVLFGVPAWWLGYMALLGRPVANGGAAQMEWYPPGRLVLWAALFGAAVTAGMLAIFWGDEATIRHSLRSAFDTIMTQHAGADGPGLPPLSPQASDAENADLLVDLTVQVLPLLAAVTAALTLILNLWLAGMAVRLSGRLQRPWPDLTALSLPSLAAMLYGASLAGAFLSDLPGLVARVFAATLTAAFAMVGFAVLHTVTRGVQGRTAILGSAYACTFFLALWPVLLMTILGVAETLLGLRQRFSGRGPPPAAPKP
jgi:hypothetical protein